MVRRTKEDAERTRNALLDAAEKLFHERGVARTSLEQIARAAGVTRGAVYWHFADKAALFEAMLARARLPQEDVLEGLFHDPRECPLLTLRQACKDALRLLATDRQRQRVYAILMHRCEYVEEMQAVAERKTRNTMAMLDGLTRLFEDARREGVLAAHWRPEAAALGLHGMMVGLVGEWLLHPDDFNLAGTGPECVDSFFASLAPADAEGAGRSEGSEAEDALGDDVPLNFVAAPVD